MSVEITINIVQQGKENVGFRISVRGQAGGHTSGEAAAASKIVKKLTGYLEFLKSEGLTGSDENCEYMYPNQLKH